MFRPPLHIQGRDPGVFLLVLSAVCLLLWLYSTRLMRNAAGIPPANPDHWSCCRSLASSFWGAAALLALERL